MKILNYGCLVSKPIESNIYNLDIRKVLHWIFNNHESNIDLNNNNNIDINNNTSKVNNIKQKLYETIATIDEYSELLTLRVNILIILTRIDENKIIFEDANGFINPINSATLNKLMNIGKRQPKLIILVSNENADNVIQEFTDNNINIIYANNSTSNERWCEFFQQFLPKLLSNYQIIETVKNYFSSNNYIDSISSNIKSVLNEEYTLIPNSFCPTLSLPLLESIEVYGNKLLQNLIEFILMLKKKRSRSIIIEVPNIEVLNEFFLIVSHYFLYRQIFCCTLIILETFLPGIYDYLDIKISDNIYSDNNVAKICTTLSNLFHVMIVIKNSNLTTEEKQIKSVILDKCPKVKAITFKMNEPNPLLIKNEYE